MALDILTSEELATLLGCEAQHVNTLAAHHQLPAIRYGRSWRFPVTALNGFFERQALRHLEEFNEQGLSTRQRTRGRQAKPPADLSKTVYVGPERRK